MGSKARIAKHLLPFLKTENGLYYEPFAGGMNLISEWNHPHEMIYANDYNPYVMAVFESMLDGWKPEEYYSKDYYAHVRETYHEGKIDPWVVGYLGICCSFRGKWFGGWVGNYSNGSTHRNYQKEAANHMFKQIEKLKTKRITFSTVYYDLMDIEPGSTVYCDPPYEGTTQYKTTIDYKHFWNWIRDISTIAKVFVSGYQAPDDFETVWEMPITNDLGKIENGSRPMATERLFKWK